MSNKFTVILDDEDADLLKSLARIFSSFQATGVEQPATIKDHLDVMGAAEEAPRRSRRSAEPAEAPAEEVPPTTRRRRAGADAGSSTTEPASDAGASGGRRARRSAEPEPAPAPAAEEPRRRRRTEAPQDDRITDADLTKAASQAGEKLTPKLVMQIIKEDHGVETVNDIPQEERRKFLETLKLEMSGD